jgi:ABC-type uncharacterized transport system substrate-binding protein
MTTHLSRIALALALLIAPLAAEAQQVGKVYRVGILLAVGTPESAAARAFRSGLHDLGWVEGQTVALEFRSADGNPEQYPGLTADLLRLPVDVILVVSTAALPAVRRATTTIPVVAATMADPVGAGYAQSFARPGGNITGLTFQSNELVAKRVQLLKEAIPNTSQVALLWHPRPDTAPPDVYKAAAAALGLQLQVFEVRKATDLEAIFPAMARSGARAVIFGNSPLFAEHRQRIAAIALKHRLPTISGETGFAEAGGLMNHGPSLPANFRRAAVYVDKILKGANPAELPIEQPTTVELIINVKTAKALGLTIPPPLLLRADRIIE